MTVFWFVVVAVCIFLLGVGGMIVLDHKFSQAVQGRDYTVKGRRVLSDDPFVRKTFRKFHAIRVAYSFLLIALLVVVVSNVG
ncbi:endonuclease [Roseibium suaedae]|uniref:Endonuclease n=1 Tax=Roseibium suaedae TaxID=735517 RepID=A0A1M7IPC5_9HYPH|nr:endonuclease [Roseibium suaedae]SHM42519.1 hypothetical protein SAMN05444272_2594 [Roseibium suaedae]